MGNFMLDENTKSVNRYIEKAKGKSKIGEALTVAILSMILAGLLLAIYLRESKLSNQKKESKIEVAKVENIPDFQPGDVVSILAFNDDAFLVFDDITSMTEYLNAKRANSQETIDQLSHTHISWHCHHSKARILVNDYPSIDDKVRKLIVLEGRSMAGDLPTGYVFLADLKRRSKVIERLAKDAI